jgi:hypothetical protein
VIRMEGINFATIVKLFFQFGPFAIMPYLLIWALPRSVRQLKTASKDMKPILKRNIFIYQVLIFVLIVFCVGFWVLDYLGPTYYYGEIINLNPAEHEIKSYHLYLKKFTNEGDYILNWIWKKEKDDKYAKIKLKCIIPEGNVKVTKPFFIYPDKLERCKCTFSYSPEDGVLIYKGEPLPSEFGGVAVNTKTEMATNSVGSLLYAAPLHPNLDGSKIDNMITNFQAIDSTIRDQSVDEVIASAAQNRQFVIQLLHQGFIILKKGTQGPVQQQLLYNKEHLLTSLLAVLNQLPRNWCKDFNEWKSVLGEQTIDFIVEEAGSKDNNIKSLALNFLLRFGKEFAFSLENKFDEARYQNRDRFVTGAIEFYSKLPENKKYLKKLREHLSTTDRPKILTALQLDILAPSSYRLPENLNKTQTQVLNNALKLKEENIAFKWGGKNPKTGFDSSGFIAYIFHQFGLLEKPHTWWSGKLRSKFGSPREKKKPKELGDLVFYMGGYVMLYLGDNNIIGMTESGIVISDYQNFRGEPIRVNKVNYK